MFKFRTLLMLLATFALGGYWSLKAVERYTDATPDLIDATADDNYSQIEKGLYVGGLIGKPPPGTAAVLNLCDFKDEYQVKYYKHMPVPDGKPAPSLEWLRDAVKFVEDNRAQDRTTYIHCFAGISRSVMVTTAYLMKKNNWSRDRALTFVRKSRPIADPNPAFMERLAEWEKKRP